MRINNTGSRFPLDPQTGVSPARPEPVDSGQARSGAADQVVLSSAGASTLTDSAARLSDIKAIVDSGDYDPQSLPIAARIIDGALARFS